MRNVLVFELMVGSVLGPPGLAGGVDPRLICLVGTSAQILDVLRGLGFTGLGPLVVGPTPTQAPGLGAYCRDTSTPDCL